MKSSWHNSYNYGAIIVTPIYAVNITYFVRLIFLYNMAVYTITYKFTYVYETVRSLHIRERKKNTINKFRFPLQNSYLKLSVNEEITVGL